MRLWLKIVLWALFLLPWTVGLTFLIYGGFYLGYPPYIPAFLNNVNKPILRRFTVENAAYLEVFGNINTGKSVVTLNNREIGTFVGQFDEKISLIPGVYYLRIDNFEASGQINYKIK